MSDVKMSKWFKLPVNCMLQLNGDSPHTSQDSISFDGVNVMTGHHVEKVVVAVNSYDSNQELISSLRKEVELAKERANKARKEEQNKWMPICDKQAAQIKQLREAVIGMRSALGGYNNPPSKIKESIAEINEALAATKE